MPRLCSAVRCRCSVTLSVHLLVILSVPGGLEPSAQGGSKGGHERERNPVDPVLPLVSVHSSPGRGCRAACRALGLRPRRSGSAVELDEQPAIKAQLKFDPTPGQTSTSSDQRSWRTAPSSRTVLSLPTLRRQRKAHTRPRSSSLGTGLQASVSIAAGTANRRLKLGTKRARTALALTMSFASARAASSPVDPGRYPRAAQFDPWPEGSRRRSRRSRARRRPDRPESTPRVSKRSGALGSRCRIDLGIPHSAGRGMCRSGAGPPDSLSRPRYLGTWHPRSIRSHRRCHRPG